MSHSTIIKSIASKVELLIEENKKLRENSAKLTEQRDRLKLQNNELIKKIAEQENRVEVLELKDSMAGDSDSVNQARTRVNRLIKEVDRCIALLT